MKMSITWCLIACAALLCGCRLATLHTAADGALPRGTLLLIGGGLDDDNRPVYERFLTLAAANGPARIVIATAATGSQDQEAIDKSEALRTWAPQVQLEVVRRETPTGETVAAIDRATAKFFTGGDQQRIVERYRPHDTASPEWLAMRRLLARGGVHLKRDGLARTGLVARIIGQGDRLHYAEWPAMAMWPSKYTQRPSRLRPGDSAKDHRYWFGTQLTIEAGLVAVSPVPVVPHQGSTLLQV